MITMPESAQTNIDGRFSTIDKELHSSLKEVPRPAPSTCERPNEEGLTHPHAISGTISRRSQPDIHPASKEDTASPISSQVQQILIAFTITMTIQDDLHKKESDLQWILSAYNLPIGCLLLFCGRIADLYGKKKVLLVGMTTFAIFTLIGGFMQNGSGLIDTRALAGCSVAMVMPNSNGMIAEVFSDKARSRVFTCYSAGYSVGGILGALIGGLFVPYVRYMWRSYSPPINGERNVDWIGAALITVGLVLFLFSISVAQSAPQGWKTGYIISSLILGVILIIAFFYWEHYIATRLKLI
ncbi:uncharacterized protein IL334_004019 [Kwoniella shivajii]|uniref:Major facilitator superfamily (MFS) profile domain-containing protein n=1 Tax=Kwoniella shivajii TaxID=564305 RepID=A0ABZ1CZ99_9TREE|nr:hypothetical protein IL334_004019 [Kwoniella shivajii]